MGGPDDLMDEIREATKAVDGLVLLDRSSTTTFTSKTKK
jgi:hypothetical protein